MSGLGWGMGLLLFVGVLGVVWCLGRVLHSAGQHKEGG